MKFITTLAIVAASSLSPFGYAADFSVLKCEVELNEAVWTTVAASFIEERVYSAPGILDFKPENLGGANPRFDSMVYCSTITFAEGAANYSIVTKRLFTPTSELCGQISGEVVSTQTETRPFGTSSFVDYRFYTRGKPTTQRRRVYIVAAANGATALDSAAANAACTSIANAMPSL